MIKAVELFSGNGDITKTLKENNILCVSVDYDIKKEADFHYNVYEIDETFLKQFNFIWLSPDCTTYSYAARDTHRIKGHIPVSQYAKECDINNTKLFEKLIKLDIPFICENPRCHFRHMPFVKGLYRITVYYSTYGMPYTKPTDLFTNRKELLQVFNTKYIKGSKHLDYVKGYNDFLGRCKMPNKLLLDIVKTIKENIL